MKRNKISIIGAGYVGLPTALLLASKNKNVELIDIDKSKIDKLKKGEIFINEQKIKRLFKSNSSKKNIKFSLKLQESEVYIICVPSNLGFKKQQNKKPIWDVIKRIKPKIKRDDLIIIETTCEVGITKEIVNYFKKNRKDLFDDSGEIQFSISYCPERVFPGKTLDELKNNTRIIGGFNKKSSAAAKKIFDKFSKKNIVTDHKSAELVKLVENSYRNINIGFSNELSILCKNLKLNFSHIRKLSNLHPRVNLLNSGVGVGGHCIPIDPYFLVSKYKKLSILNSSIKANENKTKWVSNKIIKKLKKSKIKRVLIWGITYKADVSDTRESPSIKIIKKLQKEKFIIKIVDFDASELKGKEFYNFNIIDKPRKYLDKYFNIILVNHKKFKKYKSDILKNKYLDLCDFIK